MFYKAMTMRDVMKLSPAELKRLARREENGRPLPEVKRPAPAPHPMLKRWAKPEKDIEIVG